MVVSPQKSLTDATVISHKRLISAVRRAGQPQTLTRRNNSCIVFRSDAAFANDAVKANLPGQLGAARAGTEAPGSASGPWGATRPCDLEMRATRKAKPS